jgi:c-di-GMP-binding flagellar brake protein YcgR
MSLLHFRFKERRRTVRVALTVGLTIRWKTEAGESYLVKTVSQSVSQNGGLFQMDEPVTVGQILQMVNDNTSKEIEARVTTIRKARDGKTYIGIEFLTPEINFWHMRFPVPGTRPIRRPAHSKVSA